jgi:hypothetical protein
LVPTGKLSEEEKVGPNCSNTNVYLEDLEEDGRADHIENCEWIEMSHDSVQWRGVVLPVLNRVVLPLFAPAELT